MMHSRLTEINKQIQTAYYATQESKYQFPFIKDQLAPFTVGLAFKELSARFPARNS